MNFCHIKSCNELYIEEIPLVQDFYIDWILIHNNSYEELEPLF